MESTQPVNCTISMPANRDSGEDMQQLQQALLDYRIAIDARPKCKWCRYLCIAMGAVPGAAVLAAGTVTLINDTDSMAGAVMLWAGICAMFCGPACIRDRPWSCDNGHRYNYRWGGGAGAGGG